LLLFGILSSRLQLGDDGVALLGMLPAQKIKSRAVFLLEIGEESRSKSKPFPSLWVKATPILRQLAFLSSRSRTTYAAKSGLLVSVMVSPSLRGFPMMTR
jgi:hypothetical protein